jgi:antitoxin (DNA-binding transcriptional repressor) of toxin-antitoxin stability system
MSPPLPEDPGDVETLAAAVLGVEPVAVSRVPSFAGNRVFRVSRPSRQRAVFFKFGSSADIAREHHALVLAADSGVPVPEVEATDIDARFSPYPRIAARTSTSPSCRLSSTWPARGGTPHSSHSFWGRTMPLGSHIRVEERVVVRLCTCLYDRGMSTMSVSQARAALPAILDRVLAGEEVTITRHGEAVAVVVRPDAVRVRRADRAIADAERLRDLLERGRAARLADAPAVSTDRAEQLIAAARAAR